MAKKAVAANLADTKIIAYKGFNRDLSCTPNGVKFQYEVGKTYNNGGQPVIWCGSGAFHSCENPLDTWSYYAPGSSVYHEVTPAGQIAREANSDTKIASAEITIHAELKIPELVRRFVSWVMAQPGVQNGDYGHGVANGYKGHGVANGDYGHGVANGDYGHGVANGTSGHGVANGDYGHGVANGTSGHGVANGYKGHGVANGDYGHGVANGDYGHGVANGDYGHGVANGYKGHGVANGYKGHGVANGDYGHGVANGDYGHGVANGYKGHGVANGTSGHGVANGDYGHGVANGDYGHAKVGGKSAVAAALGIAGTAEAVEGSAIMLAAYDDNIWPPKLVAVRASMVGENGIEAGKLYKLSLAGEFLEVSGD